MHRFYMPPNECAGDVFRLASREAHHALNVLRLRAREAVTVLDGLGHEIQGEVAEISRQAVSISVRQRVFVPPPPCQITLLQALPKGKIMDSIIQKAVELGAGRIIPILSERVVSQLDGEGAESKREKWQQVAIEAIKQSGAAWLPSVATPMSPKEFLEKSGALDLVLVGSLQAERRHPRACLEELQVKIGRPPKSVAVWIGPEGDFTRDELAAILAAGAQPITLGRLVLRVETAAIYCLSVLNYELNTAS